VSGEVVIQHGDDDLAIVELRGEHDHYTAPRLVRALEEQLEAGLHVVVDLRETLFVDSTSISALIRMRADAAAAERGFAVVLGESTGWSVRRLFEITRLDSILPVVPTLGAALARVRRSEWAGTERRASADRRGGLDRRGARATLASALDRRTQPDRRSGADRRNA
jgi:anti-anti-sigma factor